MILIPLLIRNRKKIYLFAFICSLGSILSACLGYLIAQFIRLSPSGEFSQLAFLFYQYVPGFDKEIFNNIKILGEKYDLLIIFITGFIPIPFQVFTLGSSAFSIGFLMFAIASLISRSSSFFLLASIVKLYGVHILTFIVKYFNLLLMVFTILLVCGIFFKVIF